MSRTADAAYASCSTQIHPSFTAIHRIPSLVHLLRKTFTVYRFGLDEGTDPNDGKTSTGSGQFICTRLFSHGGAILLTDSLVLENPIACDRIVRWFGDKLKLRAPNTWKLVGRPGFKDWVLAVANERGDGDGLRSAEFKACVKSLRAFFCSYISDSLP